ncbi:MAG: hypothetical protein HYT72_04430 [Candidatus Aenigmarchaeota archaeon]|nr:hypothetical protein [Candidatus Aenigmarchaeota archaeon]
MQKKIIVLAVIIVLAAVISYFYFGIVSPVVPKPLVSKPVLAENQEIKTEHVNYVVNELGAYKLHPSLSGEPAEIEVVSAGKLFTITTQDGKTATKEGKAANPDIRITAPPAAFVRLFSAADITAEISKLYSDGLIEVALLKDQATLALKGYKGIYDELQQK